MINVSVLITTLNEAERLPRCLAALKGFDEIIVIDSNSADTTKQVVQSFGAQYVNYKWSGQYPKKRQWCLDNLDIKNDFVFFVDADEIITSELVEEIKALDFSAAGYFVKGKYIWNNQILNHGLKNNKLALFNRHKVEFPVIDDLDIKGMGEIEGHYQPVLKSTVSRETICQLRSELLHDASGGWQERHQRYAYWEAEMIKRNAYPKDPSALRQSLKKVFRRIPLRGFIAFCHSFIWKRGFLDGRAGFDFAVSRMRYYKIVSAALKTNRPKEKSGEVDKVNSAI